MIGFTEFLLLEVLDSQFDVHHDLEFKNWMNGEYQHKIYPGHTAVMYSDHMKNNNMRVLRVKNKAGEVEYHLINLTGKLGKLSPEEQDNKSLLHALKIIKDDSKSYLNDGHKIKLQSHTDHQFVVYKRLANHLIKDHPDKKVTDVGKTDRLDGDGTAKTLMIESFGCGKPNFAQKYLHLP